MSLRRSKRNVIQEVEVDVPQTKNIKCDKGSCHNIPSTAIGRTRASTSKGLRDFRKSEDKSDSSKIKIEYLSEDDFCNSVKKRANRFGKNNNSRLFKDLEIEANLKANVKVKKVKIVTGDGEKMYSKTKSSFSSSGSNEDDSDADFETKRNKKLTSKNKLYIKNEFHAIKSNKKLGKASGKSIDNDDSSSESEWENVLHKSETKKIISKAKRNLKIEEIRNTVKIDTGDSFVNNSDEIVGDNGESDCDWGDVLNEIKKEKFKIDAIGAWSKHVDGNVSSSDSDWEEVKGFGNDEVDSEDEKQECHGNLLKPYVIPAEGVVITIEAKKNKKKQLDFQAEIIKRMNRFQVELQFSMHKVHLLCYLAYGLKINSLINSDDMRAFALSILPPSHSKFKMNLPSFRQILRWFKENFSLKIDAKQKYDRLSIWVEGFSTRHLPSEVDFVCCFLIFLRLLKFKSRLIISFRPVPRKLPSEKLLLNAESIKNTAEQLKTKINKEDEPGTSTETIENSKTEMGKTTPKSRTARKKSKVNKEKGNTKSKNKNRKKSDNDEDCNNKNRRSGRVKVKVKYVEKEVKSESEDDEDAKINMDIDYVHSSGNDESGAEDVFVVKKEKAQMNRRKSLKRTEVSLDDVEIWVEVYIDREQRWISVNCLREEFDLPHQFEKSAARPFDYVMAFDESNYVFDVTRRYAEQCLHPEHRKRRVDSKWWNATLKPFSNPYTKVLAKEMTLLDNKLLERPLPNTFTEYKNHPYYVLERHLLKFEGIYPPDAVPVGYFRKEPVYSRDSVHELHSRETWFKEARLIKLHETPYKLVKARPKWIRRTRELKYPDKPLEIFGHWQTEDYVPPVAKDGKVPRNEHGNVDFLKPCMLPIGTVHLRLPGLNRVAKKLTIDCGAAFAGWDFSGGSNHPTFDGWIVCTEFKDVLIEAWHEEQMIAQDREQTKKEKRVYGNWRRFIKGVLIAERIKAKYLTKN